MKDLKTAIDRAIFADDAHRARYEELRGRVLIDPTKYNDHYREALSYLLALNIDCYDNVHDLYNFKEHSIIPEGISEEWQTGTNTIKAYISKKSNPITTPYALAEKSFIVEIDPRMPDMGNHTSPNNSPLQLQTDGSYQGTVNLTMTGLWRLHLTVKDAEGNIVAGGEELNTLFWDVTI